MKELGKPFYQCIGVKYSIICATLGLVMALLLLVLIVAADVGAGNVRAAFSQFKFLNESLIAIMTLYVSAFILGKAAGGIICRVGIHNPRIWLIGICLAWSCLILSVLFASSPNFFSNLHREPSVTDAFIDYISKPVLSVMCVGWLPALILGLFYAQRVKIALKEVQQL